MPPCDMSGRKLQYSFSGASLCVHFIKAIVCHGKQLLPHKEKLSDDTAFGNGDTFLLVSFSSLSLHPLSGIAVAAMGSPADKRLCLPMKGNRRRMQFCGPSTSLVAQTVKHLSTMQETQVRSLGWEDPMGRKWQSTPVLLPGKSHGQRSLVGYSPWGCKESDTTVKAQHEGALPPPCIVRKDPRVPHTARRGA